MKQLKRLLSGTNTDAPHPQLGQVLPGTSSGLVTLDYKNTGTEALQVVRVWLEGSSNCRVTLNGVAVTATSEATAQEFGPLAVGAVLEAVFQWVTPADAPEDATVQTGQLEIVYG